jgi:hypothetical protein
MSRQEREQRQAQFAAFASRVELDFERWMLLVDEHCRQILGVHVHDLPDYPFRDAYNDDVSALEVVDHLIKRYESGDV